jgi:hypothetical protein
MTKLAPARVPAADVANILFGGIEFNADDQAQKAHLVSHDGRTMVATSSGAPDVSTVMSFARRMYKPLLTDSLASRAASSAALSEGDPERSVKDGFFRMLRLPFMGING